MSFVVSKEKNWDLNMFIKVPHQLIFCTELHANTKLLFIMLTNQVGFRPVSVTTIDRCLNIHRSTRIRCIAELKEYGFIKGDDKHIVLCDPMPILARLKAQRRNAEAVIDEMFYGPSQTVVAGNKNDDDKAETRDYLKEAADAWNRYRPKDYRRINRISAQLIKAIDLHMRDLSVPPHHYDEFFSILKAGIEKSDFWSTKNTSKTLQSITGVGTPTDKKKSNVYTLFNDGVESPAEPTEEKERGDTIVYPAAYRTVIDDYEAAQTSYSEACRNGNVTDAHRSYVIRTEKAITDVGLDPAKFRFKFGIREWPTSTPEPEESRVVNWVFDDEYDYAY